MIFITHRKGNSMNRIKIKNRWIGEGEPAYIIAEMSANHAGSIERAKEIIRAAKESGADCVKIQTYTPDTITMDCDNKYFHIDQGTWEGENLYQLYGKAYTPWEWQAELKAEADKVGIDFFSTPFDKTAVDFLESIGVEFYKIASFELVDLPLIRYTAEKGKPMILSTGMATLAEIEEAVETIRSTGNEQFAFLRCASAYPAISDEMNLRAMQDMAKRFDIPVGLSDHSMGGLAAAASVAMGGSIIEKHFCLSRDIENPDSSFSMEPAEFAEMVSMIRQVERARGKVSYGPTKQEASNICFRKSIFVAKDIKAGETFTEENIRVIRPGYGLHSREYEFALGKKCTMDVQAGTPFTADMIPDYMTFRPVAEADRKLLFDWANDEETRKASFSGDPITWETHEKWFAESLKNPDRKMFICCHGEKEVGLLRLDIETGEDSKAVISYQIAPGVRHRGYGKQMLLGAEKCEVIKDALKDKNVMEWIAYVKQDNLASAAIFEGLGYTKKQMNEQFVFTKSL